MKILIITIQVQTYRTTLINTHNIATKERRNGRKKLHSLTHRPWMCWLTASLVALTHSYVSKSRWFVVRNRHILWFMISIYVLLMLLVIFSGIRLPPVVSEHRTVCCYKMAVLAPDEKNPIPNLQSSRIMGCRNHRGHRTWQVPTGYIGSGRYRH